MLTDEQVIEIVKKHYEGLFPRTCPGCNRPFSSLAHYLVETTHVGEPVSFDADDGKWEPPDDTGIMSFSNCPCGATLALESKGIGIATMWQLLGWARARSEERGITVSNLLAEVRDQIDARVLPGG